MLITQRITLKLWRCIKNVLLRHYKHQNGENSFDENRDHVPLRT